MLLKLQDLHLPSASSCNLSFRATEVSNNGRFHLSSKRENANICHLQYFMTQSKMWKACILLNSIIPNLGDNGCTTFAKNILIELLSPVCEVKILSKNESNISDKI